MAKKGRSVIDPSAIAQMRADLLLLPKVQQEIVRAAATYTIEHYKRRSGYPSLEARFNDTRKMTSYAEVVQARKNPQAFQGPYGFSLRKNALTRGRQPRYSYKLSGKFMEELKKRKVKAENIRAGNMKLTYSIWGRTMNLLGSGHMRGVVAFSSTTAPISYEYQRKGKMIRVTRMQTTEKASSFAAFTYAAEWALRPSEIAWMNQTYQRTLRLAKRNVPLAAFGKRGELKKKYAQMLAKANAANQGAKP